MHQTNTSAFLHLSQTDLFSIHLKIHHTFLSTAACQRRKNLSLVTDLQPPTNHQRDDEERRGIELEWEWETREGIRYSNAKVTSCMVRNYQKEEERFVQIPEDLSRVVSRTNLMSEEEWRNLGIQGSPGWYHHRMTGNPKMLRFRRRIQPSRDQNNQN